MGKRSNISIGDKYGLLTILSEQPPKKFTSGRQKRMFRCLCDCGNVKDCQLGNLLSGNTRSCGKWSCPGSSKRHACVLGHIILAPRGEGLIFS
jgi:hypothetical protein